MDVPATKPDEQELHPHRRQPQPHMVFEELLPLLVPPTEPVEPLLQVQVHVQRFEVLELLVPPTEPEFRQQRLQQTSAFLHWVLIQAVLSDSLHLTAVLSA